MASKLLVSGTDDDDKTYVGILLYSHAIISEGHSCLSETGDDFAFSQVPGS